MLALVVDISAHPRAAHSRATCYKCYNVSIPHTQDYIDEAPPWTPTNRGHGITKGNIKSERTLAQLFAQAKGPRSSDRVSRSGESLTSRDSGLCTFSLRRHSHRLSETLACSKLSWSPERPFAFSECLRLWWISLLTPELLTLELRVTSVTMFQSPTHKSVRMQPYLESLPDYIDEAPPWTPTNRGHGITKGNIKSERTLAQLFAQAKGPRSSDRVSRSGESLTSRDSGLCTFSLRRHSHRLSETLACSKLSWSPERPFA
ncbi:hypothetical protein DEO72_LG5g2107 [Vigna unguiculata]|uniref:Uncharacterized protein n=1 Tax=Vigna unguiculata TaxID=3917 RepID=A0A4D6LYG7_VIGUN|nr:hypothetical protein DEO72_LG5g2107 [Vigna unguiculata]